MKFGVTAAAKQSFERIEGIIDRPQRRKIDCRVEQFPLLLKVGRKIEAVHEHVRAARLTLPIKAKCAGELNYVL